ncbi:serine O-acetyltransferase [Desulfoplanes formicivorans]|uniref:Serine O-acetyltransferase n=1 Tax=Desulfoplanes formicivorans TaxID=1592317 RepID=A0A194AB17_9BACT|nr:hypothetical protein [Desulfoplanes formicivorans]GAU07372.1 serine O-acetyltransferase [Desulfoplanes formicivorans]
MIRNKKQLCEYLRADAAALGLEGKNPLTTINLIWRYQIVLRKIEYYINSEKSKKIFFRPFYYLQRIQFEVLGILLGFTIPPNVFGPGLAIVHRGTIVVNGNARVGSHCRIHVCVNIGASGGNTEAPQIGDNVYIGPGVKVFGNIKIADNITIGANAVVNKNFSHLMLPLQVFLRVYLILNRLFLNRAEIPVLACIFHKNKQFIN